MSASLVGSEMCIRDRSSTVLRACPRKMRVQLAFAMLGVLVQVVRRSRIARVRAHGVHSRTVARSCPSARVLGAD
eukprot:1952516-Alexandrium_andersonii.AAC.1